MHQVRKLIAQIRAVLGENPPPLPLEPLAAGYAHWREEAARRLEAIAGMLAKGSEHSALELAEAPPPLLELVAELRFAEEPQWQSLCSRHELPAAPLLDTRTIAALSEVYAKGISANSPLYHDYRAAVTARDDAKALHIIRTITRVNPSDANAQAELERLLNKFMHAKIESLRTAVASGDDAAAADIVDDLEKLAPQEKLEAQPGFTRGLAVRKRVRLAEATRELPAALEELERLQQSDDWHGAGASLELLQEQEHTLGLTLDATQSARRDAVQRFVEARRTDVQEQARFLQAVEKLRAYGEQAATRAAGQSTLTLDEAQELEAKFAQLEHEVKQFRLTVPAPAAGSIRASGRAVRGAAGGIRRGRLWKRVAAVAAVLTVTGAGLAWFARGAIVKSYRDKLAGFQQEGKALAAHELLQQIDQRNLLGIHSDPELQAAVADTSRWVAGQQERCELAEEQIAALEKEDIIKSDPTALHAKLTAVAKLTDELAPDLAPPLRERIAVVQRRQDAQFAMLKLMSSNSLRGTLYQAQVLLANVSFEMPATAASDALGKAAPLIAALEKQVHHPVPALRPGADLVESFDALSKKHTDFRKELTALTAALTAMQQAETLEAYAAALKPLAAVRFTETAVAQPVLAAFPDADDVLARLLMDGDRSAWQAVRGDKAFGAAMHPQDVRPEEVSMLLALRGDPNLADVWQWTLVEDGKVRSAWSRTEPRKSIVGGESRWSGMLWDADGKDITPAFAQVKLPSTDNPVKVSSVLLSATSQLLAGLKLQQITDDSGRQWSRPMLEVLDELVKSKTGPATARAILLQQIGALTALRPYEWGRHYSPTLRRDLAELDALCGGRRLNTYEWMLPATVAKLEPKLGEFFQRISDHNYLNEARRCRDIALAVRDAGLLYAGFVDADGNAQVLQGARSATELWCLRTQEPVLLKVAPGAPNAGLATQTRACPPFSPLFHIPVDRAALLTRMKTSHPAIPFLRVP